VAEKLPLLNTSCTCALAVPANDKPSLTRAQHAVILVGWHGQSGQYADDGNHHHQFNQCKSTLFALLHK